MRDVHCFASLLRGRIGAEPVCRLACFPVGKGKACPMGDFSQMTRHHERPCFPYRVHTLAQLSCMAPVIGLLLQMELN
uniref:Uncharacterized protein n=1 Tax=Anguilla anguilla TaxID=7936 RepID=A0A0E9WWX9_ANGAN